MVTAQQIEHLVDAISLYKSVERVILFGSYAAGNPDAGSDVDLLLIMDYHGQSYRAASKVRCRVDAGFPFDLIVRSPSEIAARLKLKDAFISEILQQGLVLYAADDTRMGSQGRGRLRRRLKSASVAAAGQV